MLQSHHDSASPGTPRESYNRGSEIGARDGITDQRDAPQAAFDASERDPLGNVLHSDIGVSTLLTRLKQSISSTKDFATFLKRRSVFEDEHAQGLKKLSKSTHELIRRPENRQGSFAYSYEEITKVHDQMADQGLQFAMALHQMSDDLNDLATNMDRQRKSWKQTGLNAEKKVQDSEAAMDKAKGKYDSMAEQYDRARTGDKQGGRFGLKGPKSAAQQEEDLSRKLNTADSDYASKVHAAQTHRHELINSTRPESVRALRELITECDAGLSYQLQRFASLNEKLVLGIGLCVSPLKGQDNGTVPEAKSLREVAQQVDNERDFKDYVLSFSNKAGTRISEIRYEKHPTLASPKPTQSPSVQQQSFNAPQPAIGTPNQSPRSPSGGYEQGFRSHHVGQISGVTPYQAQNRNFSQMSGQPNPYATGLPPPSQLQPPQYANSPAPQLPQIDNLSMSGANNTHRPEQSPSWASSTSQGPSHAGADGPGSGPNGSYRPGTQAAGPGNSNRTDLAPSGSSNQFRSGPPPLAQISPQSYGASNRPENPHPAPNEQYQPPAPFAGPRAGRSDSTNTNYRAQTVNNGPSSGPSGTYRPNDVVASPAAGPPASYRSPTSANGPPSGLGSNYAPTPITPVANSAQGRRPDMPVGSLPPLNPVFGVSLDELFRRDNSAVPMIVYQCTQAVDLFGLNVEGIYRTSGSTPHIMEMKSMFDNDSRRVDFSNPAAFYHDIAAVTTLLKHFLRDLPDPLLTAANYHSFIHAARIDDDIVRRDSLHAIINSLPDPNYATLRVLILHLNRVAQHSAQNRMTPSNLAICFGPTVMGQQTGSGAPGVGSDIRDAGWQARVIETVLLNTFQIFDDDE